MSKKRPKQFGPQYAKLANWEKKYFKNLRFLIFQKNNLILLRRVTKNKHHTQGPKKVMLIKKMNVQVWCKRGAAAFGI